MVWWRDFDAAGLNLFFRFFSSHAHDPRRVSGCLASFTSNRYEAVFAHRQKPLCSGVIARIVQVQGRDLQTRTLYRSGRKPWLTCESGVECDLELVVRLPWYSFLEVCFEGGGVSLVFSCLFSSHAMDYGMSQATLPHLPLYW